MTPIVGQYGCKADTKGRINIPTSLKNKLVPYMQEDFVIKKSPYHRCLELQPKSIFDAKLKKIMAHPNKGKRFSLWFNKFSFGLQEVNIDTETGRLQIPKMLFEEVGLEKEIMLNGVYDHVQIWNRSIYTETNESMSEEEFELISDEIFNAGVTDVP